MFIPNWSGHRPSFMGAPLQRIHPDRRSCLSFRRRMALKAAEAPATTANSSLDTAITASQRTATTDGQSAVVQRRRQLNKEEEEEGLTPVPVTHAAPLDAKMKIEAAKDSEGMCEERGKERERKRKEKLTKEEKKERKEMRVMEKKMKRISKEEKKKKKGTEQTATPSSDTTQTSAPPPSLSQTTEITANERVEEVNEKLVVPFYAPQPQQLMQELSQPPHNEEEKSEKE